MFAEKLSSRQKLNQSFHSPGCVWPKVCLAEVKLKVGDQFVQRGMHLFVELSMIGIINRRSAWFVLTLWLLHHLTCQLN